MSARITDLGVLALVNQIYDAAVDPALWPDFLSTFARAVNGRGTLLYSHNVETLAASTVCDPKSLNVAVDFDSAFLKSLDEYYNFVNVWGQNEVALRPGRPVTGSMLYPVRELPKTEFFADWLRPQDYFHAIGGIVVQDGPWALKFSSLRSQGVGDFSSEEIRLYQGLVPHLARAAQIQRRFAFLQSLAASSLAVLDTVPSPVVLLDARSRVLHVNAAAATELRRADPLSVKSSGELQAKGLARAQTALRTALAAAINPLHGARERLATVARLSRRNGETVLVQALPLPQRDRAVTVTVNQQVATCALVVHESASRQLTIGPELLRHLYGLTPSEAEVAVAVSRGLSGTEVCSELNIRYNTLKTHLKRVYAKTQTRRQSDLVRLLAGGVRGSGRP